MGKIVLLAPWEEMLCPAHNLMKYPSNISPFLPADRPPWAVCLFCASAP
ncbi:hypothetical protein LI019_15800 [Enterocloster bolteae]|nr:MULTISPECIES: hypothetical protein [Clostridia]MCB7090399.1 hypothetical protein [Enterocloster bolteae]MCH1936149.1 hypothetical protein [Enterocloster sp. OA11]